MNPALHPSTTVLPGRELADAAAQLAQDAGQQPGDLHLGDPDPGCDLALGHTFTKAHAQDPPVALAEGTQHRAEHQPSLRGAMFVVLEGQQAVSYTHLT